MGILNDATTLAAVINFINLIGNLFWSFQLKAIQGNREITSALKEQIAQKDAALSKISASKDQYKMQYQSLLAKYKELEGKVATYKQFHNHE